MKIVQEEWRRMNMEVDKAKTSQSTREGRRRGERERVTTI